MNWIVVIFAAYFINAINSVVDKFLLEKSIPNPVVYSFYVGIFSIFAVFFAPFSLEWPGLFQLFISFLVGAVFLFALFAFFTSIRKDEVSRIAPIVGSLTPVFVFAMSFIFLGERLPASQISAFVFSCCW